MSAPDRSQDVAAFINTHRHLFDAPGAPDDVRRAVLDPLCRALNVQDDGQWGKLLKPGGRIPADIIVWQSSGEHFDVMTGAEDPTQTQPVWIVRGQIHDDWQWLAVDAAVPADPPVDDPPAEPPPPSDPDVLRALRALTSEVAAARFDLAALQAVVQQLVEKPHPVPVVPPITFPVYTGKVRFLGTITLTPKP